MHVPGSITGALRRPMVAGRSLPALRLSPRHPLVGAAVALVALALLCVLALLYSPLAHPRSVEITGAAGPSQARIERALREAGAQQSTLAVSREEILRAVAAFPEVADVRIDARPPSGLTLTAIMRLPVGIATIAGRRVVVAGDGRVMERAATAELPTLDPSAGTLQIRGAHLSGAGGALDILAAAPAELLPLARTLRASTAGLEVELRRGPRLIFGNGEDAQAKWLAAATLIAEGAAAATYIDVRVPSRPAVGGIGGSRVASDLAPPVLTAPTAAAASAAVAAAPAATTPKAAAPTAPSSTAAQSPAAAPSPAASAPAASGTARQPAAPPASTKPQSPVVNGSGGGAGGATLAPGQ